MRSVLLKRKEMVYYNKLRKERGLESEEIKSTPLFIGNKEKVEVKQTFGFYESMSKMASTIKQQKKDYRWMKDKNGNNYIKFREMFIEAGHGQMIDVKSNLIKEGIGIDVKSKTGEIDENSLWSKKV